MRSHFKERVPEQPRLTGTSSILFSRRLRECLRATGRKQHRFADDARGALSAVRLRNILKPQMLMSAFGYIRIEIAR